MFDVIAKDPEARDLLAQIGVHVQLDNSVRRSTTSFVLSKIYGEKATTCGQARAARWKKQKRKSTSRLPPDFDTLNFHLIRTNYLAYCQINFRLLEHPSPIGCGWEIRGGRCRPVRNSMPAMPRQLVEHSVPDCDSDFSDTDIEDEGL